MRFKPYLIISKSSWPSDLDKDIYLTPWSRYHAYGVGILFGWLILAERKGNGFKKFVQKRKILGYSIIFALWALSLFTLYFTIYGFSDICFQVDMTKYQQSIIDVYYQPSQKWDLLSGCFSNPGAVYFWNATHRAIWAFALGLLIFLCDCGFGSFIHSFLSFKVEFDRVQMINVRFKGLEYSRETVFRRLYLPLQYYCSLSELGDGILLH
jgi:hypothetical protein